MANLKGIDVSTHQGNIDWEKVKPQIDYAILRVGFGSNIEKQDDARFKQNADACTKLGIPFGVYLYSYADNVQKAKSEAEHTLRLIKGYKLDYPVYYDLEDAGTTGKCSNALILEIAKTFCETVKAAGYTVGIYASKYWWTSKLTDAYYNEYTKWVAQYASKCTYNGSYDMWQYSSSGSVDGIAGRVDMNICYKEFAKKDKKGYAGEYPVLPAKGYLGSGDKGEQVKRLQELLNWCIGAGLTVDGDFGQNTKDAVIAFQVVYNLKADGLFGEQSLKKAKSIEKPKTLKAYTGAYPTLPAKGYLGKGDKGDQVKNLQKYLNWCLKAGLATDGDFGAKSEAAVKNFQQLYGLKADGLFGKESLNKAKQVKR